MDEPTAKPLTAAMIGFLILATADHWSRKPEPTTFDKVLFCISLISAPARKDQLEWTILALLLEGSDQRMHGCHQWEQCNGLYRPYPAIPRRLPAEQRRGWVTDQCTFFVRTSRIRPSHRAFNAFGRLSWTKATLEFCPLVSTSKYSYLPFGFCPPPWRKSDIKSDRWVRFLTLRSCFSRHGTDVHRCCMVRRQERCSSRSRRTGNDLRKCSGKKTHLEYLISIVSCYPFKDPGLIGARTYQSPKHLKSSRRIKGMSVDMVEDIFKFL